MMLKHFSLILLAAWLCQVVEAAPAADAPPKNASLVYVGTYTDTPAKSKGIYLFWLRTEGERCFPEADAHAVGSCG